MAQTASDAIPVSGNSRVAPARVFTDADFAALTRETVIFGMDAESVWGSVFVIWLMAVAVAWFRADERFSFDPKASTWGRTSISVGVGFAALLACYKLGRAYPLQGTLLAVALSIATWLALWLRARWRTLLRSKASRRGAVAVAAWIAAVQLWGQIWDWDNYFSAWQFVLLTFGVPALSLLAMTGWRWSNSGT